MQALFGFERSTPPIAIPAVTLRSLDVEPSLIRHDLTLTILDDPAEPSGTFEYHTGLFDRPFLDRLAGHYRTLLAAAAADPDAPLSRLPLLDPTEKRQILFSWNNTIRPSPTQFCLHQLFEAQVERTPDAEAVVSGSLRWSYQALNRRANQLAHHLRTLGCGPEVPVAICLARGADLLVALLATLKSGSAYVPLEPRYPDERIAFTIRDCGARVLLTQQRLADRFSAPLTPLVCVDDESSLAHYSARNPDPVADPANLAYVIYTSGSTGTPKGVCIEHRNVVAFLDWVLKQYPAAHLAGVLASSSVCFDLSVFELFAPLSCGGMVIVADDALQLPDLPARDEVSLINTVPTVMAELLCLGPLPESVRVVNLAGEPVPPGLVTELYRHPTLLQVYNLYGPSETTTYSTCALLARGRTDQPAIGRPIANTAVFVLDEHLEPVPFGLPGELYIAGAGLARGYLNRPAETARAFLRNPFDPAFGSRVYRTGDLGRYRPDGELVYLGRLDRMVKIRGARVEPAEVEGAVRKHPAVHEVVVLPGANDTPRSSLAAFVVPRPGHQLSPGELLNFLQSLLPTYLLPSAIVLIEQLPRLPSGKIDRTALGLPHHLVRDPATEVVAPQDGLERELVQIWEELLCVHPIGVTDDFFALGGNSLLAVRLIARLQQRFGRKLPLSLFFGEPQP